MKMIIEIKIQDLNLLFIILDLDFNRRVQSIMLNGDEVWNQNRNGIMNVNENWNENVITIYGLNLQFLEFRAYNVILE